MKKIAITSPGPGNYQGKRKQGQVKMQGDFCYPIVNNSNSMLEQADIVDTETGAITSLPDRTTEIILGN